MLWQKLQRKMPTTLAETMLIADTYTLGDPMQPLVDVGDSNRRNAGTQRSGPSRSHDRHDFGPKRSQPEFHYASQQVAAVDRDQGDAGSN